MGQRVLQQGWGSQRVTRGAGGSRSTTSSRRSNAVRYLNSARAVQQRLSFQPCPIPRSQRWQDRCGEEHKKECRCHELQVLCNVAPCDPFTALVASTCTKIVQQNRANCLAEFSLRRREVRAIIGFFGHLCDALALVDWQWLPPARLQFPCAGHKRANQGSYNSERNCYLPALHVFAFSVT